MNTKRILENIKSEIFDPTLILRELGDLVVYMEKDDKGFEVYALIHDSDKLYVLVYNNPLVSLRVPTKFIRKEDLWDLKDMISAHMLIIEDKELFIRKVENAEYNTSLFKDFMNEVRLRIEDIVLEKEGLLSRIKSTVNLNNQESKGNLNHINKFDNYILKIREGNKYKVSIVKAFKDYCVLKDTSGVHYFVDTIKNKVIEENSMDNLILNIYSEKSKNPKYLEVLEFLDN